MFLDKITKDTQLPHFFCYFIISTSLLEDWNQEYVFRLRSIVGHYNSLKKKLKKRNPDRPTK